jgi:Protein of unknown function (DUF1566)
VKDTQTKLTWSRCSVGQQWNGNTCTGEAQKFTFEQAQGLARNGWRVPTVRELASLIYCSNGQTRDYNDPQDGEGSIPNYCEANYARPTIAQDAFPNALSGVYWSSSQDLRRFDSIWGVSFDDGSVGYDFRGYGSAVRLVRASQ